MCNLPGSVILGVGFAMNFWKKDMEIDVAERRAERIIQKKRRKQKRSAKGLSAVPIQRRGPRSVHERNEDRHVLRGKTAVAETDGKTFEVPLLNLSSNGVMIGCSKKLAIGDQLTLSIEDCAPIVTAVRWIREERVGLEFIAETVIIAEAGVRDFIMDAIRKEHQKACYSPKVEIGSERRDVATRHPIVWLGKLWCDGVDATARLRNISRTGAMMSLSEDLHLSKGSEVTLCLGGAGDLRGTVRWLSGQECGIEFAEEFDVSMLLNETYAELAPQDDDEGIAGPREEEENADDHDVLRVRLGNVENPHRPPDMDYHRLTLDELYETLYRKPKDGPLVGPN